MSFAGRDGATPAISVLIAVRDGAPYLAEAIESALAQSYRPIEVVVVDDGSQDDTAGVASRYEPRIVFARQPPLGISVARNRAFELSSGAYLAFLDADDLFEPERLRRQEQVLAGDPEVEAVFGRVSEFVQPGLRPEVRAALRRPREAMPSHLVTAMLIRRTAFERVGPFSSHVTLNVSVEWYTRALDAGLRSTMLNEVVLRRRLHGGNVGVTRWDAGHHLVEIARASLQRKRVPGDHASSPSEPR